METKQIDLQNFNLAKGNENQSNINVPRTAQFNE